MSDSSTSGQDVGDGRWLSGSKDQRSSDLVSAFQRTQVSDNVNEYNMTHRHRGQAIIINNKDFEPKTEMSERRGTDLDASIMLNQLTRLGFSVTVKKNLKRNEMFKILRDLSALDHRSSDAFVCVILSHGDDGIVYGTDGVLETDMLIDLFKGDRCATLAGKPKIFLIQACRGHRLMEAVQVDAHQEPSKQKIPSEADILVAYSTVPGFYSWRNNTNGSWFVQALSRALDEYPGLDFLRLLTRASRMVAYDFESNAPGEMRGKKQALQIVSTLTKDIIFYQKPDCGETD